MLIQNSQNVRQNIIFLKASGNAYIIYIFRGIYGSPKWEKALLLLDKIRV